MDPPPTWFDFSTECVYTAQKHKKHKAWRDGICTCVFVRGWIVLKLFPEGASIASEPLEDWRLPPDTPAAVANQEIELQVHLVQLLGRPQPLDEQRRLSHQRPEIQAEAAPHIPAGSLQLQSPTPCGDSAPLPKRRFTGGLIRSRGLSPQIFANPPGLPAQNCSFRGLHTNGERGRPNAQTESQGAPVVCAASGPHRPAEEAPGKGSAPLPAEVAWRVNAARAVLLLNSCWGGDCWQCGQQRTLEAPRVQQTATPGLFRRLFSSANAEGASRFNGEAETNETRALSVGHTPRTDTKGKPASLLQQDVSVDAQDDSCSNEFHLGSKTPCAASQTTRRYLTPASIRPCTAALGASLRAGNAARAGVADPPVTANGYGRAAANAGHGSAEIHAGGKRVACAFQQAPRSRFLALAAGVLSPRRSSADDKLPNVPQSPRLPGLCKEINALSCVAEPSRASGAVPIVGSNDAFKEPGEKEQMIAGYQQPLQRQRPLPCLPQQGADQQANYPRGAGGALGLLPGRPPLLMTEGLPQMHGENMADALPLTFAIGPEAAPPFPVSRAPAISASACEMRHV